MKNQINLIPGEERKSAELSLLLKQVKTVGVGSVVLVVFFLAFIQVYFIDAGYKLKQINLEIKDIEAKIGDQYQAENNLFVIKNRVGLLKSFWEVKTPFLEILAELKKAFPPQIVLETIEGSGKGSLKIMLKAGNLNLLEQVEKIVFGPSFSGRFESLTVSSVSKQATGGYGITLEIISKGDNKK